MAGLTAVPFQEPDDKSDETKTDRYLYKFEGKGVSGTLAKVTSAANLEVEDRKFAIDEVVTLLVQCRVVDVGHKVEEKTGHLNRIHTLKAIDAAVLTAEFDAVRDGLR